MDRFVSNFTNRTASFRAVLACNGFEGLHAHPALDEAALEAGGDTPLIEINAYLSMLSPYSDEQSFGSQASDTLPGRRTR
jgi:MraZ protein